MPKKNLPRRVVIVFDGEKWHARRLRTIEHDLTKDEKIYRCDMPIANDLETPDEAVKEAVRWLNHYP